MREDRGQVFVDRGQGFAVPAPGSKEFDQGRFARVQDCGVEIGGEEVQDGGSGEGGGEEEGGDEAWDERPHVWRFRDGAVMLDGCVRFS